jgi:hypothetical protein
MLNKNIEHAHDPKTPNSFAMGSKPTIVGVTLSQQEIDDFNSIEKTFGRDNLNKYFNPNTMNDEERTVFFEDRTGTGWQILEAIKREAIFYQRPMVEHWILQKWAIEKITKRYNDCIKLKFPTPPRTPQTRVKAPTPNQIFPGEPMNNLTLPTPTAPPRATPKLVLTISLGIKTEVPYNALDLTLTMDQIIF